MFAPCTLLYSALTWSTFLVCVQAKGAGEAAARQLTSRQAVAEVWPLVEGPLLEDLQHVSKHKGAALPACLHAAAWVCVSCWR